jgi:hypothetical protein
MKRATLLVLVVVMVPALSQRASAQRIVDQTFLCRTPLATTGAQTFLIGEGIVGSGGKFLVRLSEGRIVSSPTLCRRVTIRVPLTRKGLPGPPELFGRNSYCAIRGRILVRIRGTYDGQKLLTSKSAVRSERTRRPISFGELVWRETDDDGRERYTSRHWVASQCQVQH